MMTTRPTELCQLASTWRGRVAQGGTWWEQKVDGYRALYFRGHDGKPGLWTRGGHRIEGVGHILHRLAMIERAAGCRLFIDGEFQVSGTLAATKLHCESGWKGGDAGTFHAFDVLGEAEWQRGGSAMPLGERKARLVALVAAADAETDGWDWREGTRGREPEGPSVTVLAHGWALDEDEVREQADRVWAAGGEGLMLKDGFGPYVRRRDAGWAKVKHPHYVPGVGVVEPALAA